MRAFFYSRQSSFLARVAFGDATLPSLSADANVLYVGKILPAAQSADLPMPLTKPGLAVNLESTKALGITISRPIWMRFDEVIR